MDICIVKMVDYPWIVNSDSIMVNLVATEKHIFVGNYTGARVPRKMPKFFYGKFWFPTWDTRGVI